MNYRHRLGLIGVSIAALAATGAQAQTNDAQTETATGEGEIVITANKRSENVQDVPKSVQVVTNDALVQQNITNIADLSKIVPTVSGVGQTLTMRGVGTGAPTIGAQSKVGIVVDDVPQPSRANIANNLQDIAQVEVLPGPQGTLAGRNATGGLINIVTSAPTSEWTGFVNVLGTTDNQFQASGFVSGPISDKISISISQYYDGFRGLYKNITLDKWANSYVYGTRNKIQFRPTEDLTITGTFFYQYAHRNGVGAAPTGVSATPGNASLGGNEYIHAYANPTIFFAADINRRSLAQLQPGVPIGPDNKYYASPNNGTAHSQTWGGVLRGEWESSGGVTLTSITSYLKENSPIRGDFLGFTLPLADFNARPEWQGYNNLLNATDYLTQEFRVSSPSSGPFHYVAGVFYSDLKQRFNYQRYWLPVDWYRTFWTETIAAYAHADYAVTDQLTIQGGIRFEHDKVKYSWLFNGMPAAQKALSNGTVANFPAIATVLSQGKDDASFVNFDFGAQYHVTSDVMVYATYAQAKQGPVYDAEDNTTAIVTSLQTLPQETVKNIEFGLKSQFLDRRVTLNIAAFQGRYANYQAYTNVPNATPNLPPVVKTQPVGRVRTRGVELSLDTHLIEELRTTLNLAYTDAKILDFPNAPCYTGAVATAAPVGTVACAITPTGNTQGDMSGETLNNAPKLRFTAGFDYAVPVGDGGLKLFVAPLLKYASKQRFDLLRLPTSYIKAKAFVDLNVGLRSDNYTLEVFASNLFKTRAQTYTISALGYTPATGFLNRVMDRTNTRYFGLRGRASF